MKLKKMPKAYLDIGEKWCDSFLVTYPVSYRYNGGITINEEWFDGFDVPAPDVPEGFKLTSIGCGLQLNARPPYATSFLEPLDEDRTVKKSELKKILLEMA